MQEKLSEHNEQAWSYGAYEAWVARYGAPEKAAGEIKRDPRACLRHLLEHLGEVKDRRIANLLGSHGRKAVALALLGADVTVVDIAEPNRRYALEVAAAAGVPLNYVVSDVLKLDESHRIEPFDTVLMELGVLHYFADLDRLFDVVGRLLRPHGRLVLRDFHPFRKILRFADGEARADGDYFDASLVTADVAYKTFLASEDLPSVKLRYWTLGEVVTALAENGFVVQKLTEESGQRWVFPPEAPDGVDARIPGLFTIRAERCAGS